MVTTSSTLTDSSLGTQVKSRVPCSLDSGGFLDVGSPDKVVWSFVVGLSGVSGSPYIMALFQSIVTVCVLLQPLASTDSRVKPERKKRASSQYL